MKKKVLAGIVIAGVLGVSGAALADVKESSFLDGLNITINIDRSERNVASLPPKKMPPDFQQGRRPIPPMSRDKNRPPEPPRGDRRPPMSRDRRMPPRSGDRMPPDFNGQRPQMPPSR